jgi:hypothetical protein
LPKGLEYLDEPGPNDRDEVDRHPLSESGRGIPIIAALDESFERFARVMRIRQTALSSSGTPVGSSFFAVSAARARAAWSSRSRHALTNFTAIWG